MGKKGYPGRLKTRKGGPEKKIGIKVYDYVSLDHLQQALLPIPSSNGIDQLSHFLPTTRDEMLEYIREIGELEPNKIIPT